MFGESESESPRVPSPWDSLMSISPSPAPTKLARTPSPLPLELIPRLVPEADDGNVEYKLQLLSPSPARFARLVTQMKWRLLEGGGQAYYELGVADSGDLIGLPREELEQSLETLEMMAGEIGASVIVVKEIEVPAVLATLAKRSGEMAGRIVQKEDGTFEGGYSTVETDDSLSATEVDLDSEDLSATVVLDKSAAAHANELASSSIFTMDSELDEPEGECSTTRFMIDLEISSVFKPRPMRARMHNHPHYAHSTGGKTKRTKKHKHLSMLSSSPTRSTHQAARHGEASTENTKSQSRRQGRDRRRDEKRKALEARATQAVDAEGANSPQETITVVPAPTEEDTLIVSLEALHVDIVEELTTRTVPVVESALVDVGGDLDDDDDVFASPTTAVPPFPTFSAHSTGESHLDVDAAAIGVVRALEADGKKEEPRLIVEALVVRKMSLGEAFLDFGGFQMI